MNPFDILGIAAVAVTAALAVAFIRQLWREDKAE